MELYLHSPSTPSWRGAQLKHSDNFTFNNRHISVGIALGYGLDDRCCKIRLPAGAENFSLHHRVQTGSGVQPHSYPIGTSGSFPGDKAAGA
jgi:hypothetical protein